MSARGLGVRPAPRVDASSVSRADPRLHADDGVHGARTRGADPRPATPRRAGARGARRGPRGAEDVGDAAPRRNARGVFARVSPRFSADDDARDAVLPDAPARGGRGRPGGATRGRGGRGGRGGRRARAERPVRVVRVGPPPEGCGEGRRLFIPPRRRVGSRARTGRPGRPERFVGPEPRGGGIRRLGVLRRNPLLRRGSARGGVRVRSRAAQAQPPRRRVRDAEPEQRGRPQRLSRKPPRERVRERGAVRRRRRRLLLHAARVVARFLLPRADGALPRSVGVRAHLRRAPSPRLLRRRFRGGGRARGVAPPALEGDGAQGGFPRRRRRPDARRRSRRDADVPPRDEEEGRARAGTRDGGGETRGDGDHVPRPGGAEELARVLRREGHRPRARRGRREGQGVRAGRALPGGVPEG